MCRTPFFPGTEFNSDASKGAPDFDALQAFRYDISNVDEVFGADTKAEMPVPSLPSLPSIFGESQKVPVHTHMHTRKNNVCRDDGESSADSDATLSGGESDEDLTAAPVLSTNPLDFPLMGTDVPDALLTSIDLPELDLATTPTDTRLPTPVSLGMPPSPMDLQLPKIPLFSSPQFTRAMLPQPAAEPQPQPEPTAQLQALEPNPRKRQHSAISQVVIPPAPWAKAPVRTQKAETKAEQPSEVSEAQEARAPEEPAPKRCKHACTNCYKSKTRCSGQRPCQRCVRLGKEDSCVDRQHKKLGRPRKARQSRTRTQAPSHTTAGVMPETLALQQMLVANPGLMKMLQQLQQQQQQPLAPPQQPHTHMQMMPHLPPAPSHMMQQQVQQQTPQMAPWAWRGAPAATQSVGSVSLPASQAAAALAHVPNNAMVHVSVALPQQPTRLPSLEPFTN